MNEEELRMFKDLAASIIISNARIYDVMLMVYSEIDPQGAVELREAHKQGRLYAPPPTFVYEKEDDDNEVGNQGDNE